MVEPFESFDFFLFLSVIAGILIYQFSRRNPRETFSPPVVVAIVFVFYAILAPRDAILIGETNIFFLDALTHYPLVWRAAFVYLLGFAIGYYYLFRGFVWRGSVVSVSTQALARFGYKLCLLVTLLYALSQGFDFLLQLNPVQDRDSAVRAAGTALIYVGFLSQYLAYSINFLILGVIFQLPASTQYSEFRFKLWSWIALATAIFTNFAFRFRLILLYAALFICWHLWKCQRPKLSWLILLLPLIVVLGAIGVNREYGGGIDAQAVASIGLDLNALLRPTLGEGKSVFNMTALLINDVKNTGIHSGYWAPLSAVLVTFVPRQLIPNKDIALYLRDAFVRVFNEPIAGNSGLAVLNIGEYYLIGGWLAVLVGGVVFGYVSRSIWGWYLSNAADPITVSIYAVAVSFIYLYISRGFLPGTLILASFIFLPFLIFGKRLRLLINSLI